MWIATYLMINHEIKNTDSTETESVNIWINVWLIMEKA